MTTFKMYYVLTILCIRIEHRSALFLGFSIVRTVDLDPEFFLIACHRNSRICMLLIFEESVNKTTTLIIELDPSRVESFFHSMSHFIR